MRLRTFCTLLCTQPEWTCVVATRQQYFRKLSLHLSCCVVDRLLFAVEMLLQSAASRSAAARTTGTSTSASTSAAAGGRGGSGDGASATDAAPSLFASSASGGSLPSGLAAHIMALAQAARASSSGGGDSIMGGTTFLGGLPMGSESRPVAQRATASATDSARQVSSTSEDATNRTSGAANEQHMDPLQRLSSAVAGSIFSDLINGALRPGDMGPPPATEKAIEALERNFQCEAGASCPICLCELAATGEGGCVRMPCNHGFHDSCLTQWLRSHNTCPVCRTQIESDGTQRPTSFAVFLQGLRDQQQQRIQAERDAAASGGSAVASSSASGGSAVASSSAGRSSASSSTAFASTSSGSSSSSTTTSTSSSPSLSEPELLALSIAELKRRLTQLNVPFAGVFEKRELQDLLREASAAQDRMRSGPRLHVQLHMDLVQMPPGATGMRALEAAARVAAMSHLSRNAASAAAAPAAATAAALTSATSAAQAILPAVRASEAVRTPVTGPAASADPRQPTRRRRREHTPGEYSEAKKSARRS